MTQLKMKLTSIVNVYSILPLIAFVVLFFNFGNKSPSSLSLSICAVFLALSIYISVHHAEVIAKRVGPSLGALILALAVTVIEVGLIVSMMSNGGADSSKIARDTVFATIMIVTNGIIGISLFIGGLQHKELGFQPLGTSSLLSILGVLSALTLVLPNFTSTSLGPTYSHNQLIFISMASIFLYLVLFWSQTVSHRNFFEPLTDEQYQTFETQNIVPSKLEAIISLVMLIVSLVGVIGLAKTLSPFIESTLKSWGAPQETVGIVIALMVLAPETLAALNAAKTNQLQTSLNLALGSGAASIALTIPIVSIYTILTQQSLILGLDNKSLAFLVLTFIAGGLTFSSKKTSSIQGLVHLVILVCYITLAFMP